MTNIISVTPGEEEEEHIKILIAVKFHNNVLVLHFLYLIVESWFYFMKKKHGYFE